MGAELFPGEIFSPSIRPIRSLIVKEKYIGLSYTQTYRNTSYYFYNGLVLFFNFNICVDALCECCHPCCNENKVSHLDKNKEHKEEVSQKWRKEERIWDRQSGWSSMFGSRIFKVNYRYYALSFFVIIGIEKFYSFQ